MDYAAEVGKRFLAEATSVACSEGKAWTGLLSMIKAIEDVVEDRESDDDDSAEDDGRDIFNNEIDTKSLVDFVVDNSGPPSWDWALHSFCADDYGLIMMTHAAGETEPELPIFAGWTPYNSQIAFEAALSAGLRAYLGDFIGVGTHCTVYGRLTPEVWSRAIESALQVWEDWRPRVEEMQVIDESGE